VEQPQTQQQIRVKFPLRYKLLLIVVLLLMIAIGFLAFSTIYIFQDDKRAYLYQAQSTVARLGASEFTNVAARSLDGIRTVFGAVVDPTKDLTPQQRGQFQATLDNQSELLAVSLRVADRQTGALKTVISGVNSSKKGEVPKPDEWDLKPDLVKSLFLDLDKSGFAFFNYSSIDSTPRLGLAVIDPNLKSKAGTPIAFGLVSLEGFGKEFSSAVTISTPSGWILYDTDPSAMFTQRSVAGEPLFESALSGPASQTTEYSIGSEYFIGAFERLPLGNVIVLARVPLAEAMKATQALIVKFVLLAAMSIGAAIIFAILFARSLTAPLMRLYQATREVAAGNFDINLKESSKDEIGVLTGSFTAMSHKITGLIKESMEKVKLEGELAVAATVQQTLIPPSRYNERGVLISSLYSSASQCGGDFWNYFWVGNRLAIFIADATGHGIPSALITASARSCFSVMHKLFEQNSNLALSPGLMLSFANRAVYEGATGKIMMTFFLGVLDFDRGILTYSSAGHNPPWLYQRVEGKYQLKSLIAPGMRLGEAMDVPPYEEAQCPFGPDDMLIMYTDGIIEGKNAEGEMYGKKKTRKMIEANLGGGPDQVVSALMADFMNHNGTKPLDDDVTLAVTKILPQAFGNA
jgi:sigma-B regulation protein RsbU (phosphoserine phosphatase)